MLHQDKPYTAALVYIDASNVTPYGHNVYMWGTSHAICTLAGHSPTSSPCLLWAGTASMSRCKVAVLPSGLQLVSLALRSHLPEVQVKLSSCCIHGRPTRKQLGCRREAN